MKTPLTRLKIGTKAKILEVAAGKQAAHRLSTMGLRVGAHITRISTFVLRGPVTVKVGSTTIAIGHGMAEKIIVESHQ